MAMVLVNVPIRMGVVRHDSGFPAFCAADLEQDCVLDRPRAGAPVDNLGTVGAGDRMHAFAILVHVRNLSAAPLAEIAGRSGSFAMSPISEGGGACTPEMP